MLRIGLAQIVPVFLDRTATTEKIVAAIADSASRGCQLVAFGETLLPGYPFWLSRSDAARWNAPDQKEWHALYLEQSVCVEEGHLDSICEMACRHRLHVILGVAERPLDRGGHSIYCSRVFIDNTGKILSIHRKLMPTYEERLAWAMGDGAGLVTHRVGEFTVGALNCWENWMPLARASLYAQGENLHVMLWPGSAGLTREITRFVALESRSFVASAGVLLRESDIPSTFPGRDRVVKKGELLYDGGSCLAGPDGAWMIEPTSGTEGVLVADLDLRRVYGERQNFDPAGHYSRPDVFELKLNRIHRS